MMLMVLRWGDGGRSETRDHEDHDPTTAAMSMTVIMMMYQWK